MNLGVAFAAHKKSKKVKERLENSKFSLMEVHYIRTKGWREA